METIAGIIEWALQHKEFITIAVGLLVRMLEKWKIKKQHKKEVQTAYGQALEAAITQLKNEKNGRTAI